MILIETSKRFRRIVSHARRQDEVADTLSRMAEGFGRPHLHSGLSIQKVAPNLFECRTSLNWRLVFEAQKGLLIFDFAGNHDEIAVYLRSRR